MSDGRRARVLFVGAFPPPERAVFGGMVTACRALMQSSLPKRVDLDLLDSTQASHPPPSLPVRLALAVRRFLTFLWRFERHKPDAVLLFAAVGASLLEKTAMAWYARMRSVPALLFPRGGGVMDACRASRFTRAWTRVAFRGARKVLCQGPAWHGFAVEVLGIAPGDAPVVPNGTATPELLAIGRVREPRAAASPVRFLFLGWLDREKGVLELLAACARLVSRCRFTLDIAGQGNASAAAFEQVERTGLREVVRFRGWLRGEALNRALAEADVLVLPSWVEGLPNAMIEAMAARLAVIVTAVGNVPDVVMDGREGLLIPPCDVDALTRAMQRLIEDQPLRAQLAHAGHEMVRRLYGVESAADALVAQVDAVTAGAGRAIELLEDRCSTPGKVTDHKFRGQ